MMNLNLLKRSFILGLITISSISAGRIYPEINTGDQFYFDANESLNCGNASDLESDFEHEELFRVTAGVFENGFVRLSTQRWYDFGQLSDNIRLFPKIYKNRLSPGSPTLISKVTTKLNYVETTSGGTTARDPRFFSITKYDDHKKTFTRMRGYIENKIKYADDICTYVKIED